MQVTFSVTGPLKHLVDRGGLTLDLRDGAKVRDALSTACDRLGEEAATRLFQGDELRAGIVVVLNDELIRRRSGERELSDGDDVTVLMPVAGG
jgi:molybdopterin converting factor small subunit